MVGFWHGVSYMPILLRQRKLRAATHSMHQFMGTVRGIFPEVVEDDLVERVTVLLYESVARSVFGDAFAAALRARARAQYKFNPPYEVEASLGRLSAQITALLEVPDPDAECDKLHGEFTHRVRCVIRAILIEANPGWDDPQIVRLVFPRFEAAAQRMRRHLQGIRQQSDFIMK